MITQKQLNRMSLTDLKELNESLNRITELQSMSNVIYEPFQKFKGRYAVLMGGSGSGKSYAAADKTIDRIVTEDNHRILCVRAQANQVTKSQFPLLVARIKKRYNIDDFEIKKAAGMEEITYKHNDNQILFAGLDDVDKLKSIFDITSVWIEEADQVQEKDLRELDRRLRGYKGVNENGTSKYMQIMITFNPVSVLSWLKKRFFDKRAKGQIMLHGKMSFLHCIPYQKCDYLALNKTNTMVIHSTYKDNKFIDEEYHKVMEELKIHDENEYNIYALGQWGVTGGTYFSKKSVNDRIIANIQPIKIGYFEFDYINHEIIDKTIKWVDDEEEGYIKIYEEPKSGYPYVIGGDTAGDGSDWNIGCLTNNVTGEDTAILKLNYDEDLYARQLYCLGRYYNNALVGVETNFSTHPLKELQRLGYPRLYYREQSPDSTTHKYQKKYGYLTTKLTRPQSLGMLRTIVREEPKKIKDLDLLMEMTTFVKNNKGRPEAMSGEHDDLVMARAINCYISHQQRDYPVMPKPKVKELPKAFESPEPTEEGFFYSGVAAQDYIRW
ncbi:MAG: PBSX family phage terminase large subunit [Vallitalea sp.]|jgi:phage terminase large subunit|nr:PBSX family phage terminase large subunit [Vallitalea sp.]